MNRAERSIYNQLRREVTPNTLSVEIPVTYSHEARQAMHKLLTIDKGMCALSVYWNNILDVYAVHYEYANVIFEDMRKAQENSDIDDVTANLPHYDRTWNGYLKPAQVDEVDDDQQNQQNEKGEKTMLNVTTTKTKCNGRKFQGYHYHVDVTDGKNIASFVSDSEGHIDFAHLGDAMDENGAKYIRDEGHKLYMMPNWYKGGDVAEQEAQMLDFVDKVLSMGINIVFTSDAGTMTYIV